MKQNHPLSDKVPAWRNYVPRRRGVEFFTSLAVRNFVSEAVTSLSTLRTAGVHYFALARPSEERLPGVNRFASATPAACEAVAAAFASAW